jgi:type IV secretion system protein VirD4
MKNKTKVKILLFIFLSVIGLVVGFFFAGYVNLLLSGGNMDDIAALRPAVLIVSLAADERHRLLTLGVCFVIVAGIAALLLVSRRETFESDTSAIAGSIDTPVAIGQGQHGTARWLKPTERKKAFALYRLSADEPIFAALLETGARDRKDVRNYAEKPADTGVAAPGAETMPAAPPDKDE